MTEKIIYVEHEKGSRLAINSKNIAAVYSESNKVVVFFESGYNMELTRDDNESAQQLFSTIYGQWKNPQILPEKAPDPNKFILDQDYNQK